MVQVPPAVPAVERPAARGGGGAHPGAGRAGLRDGDVVAAITTAHAAAGEIVEVVTDRDFGFLATLTWRQSEKCSDLFGSNAIQQRAFVDLKSYLCVCVHGVEGESCWLSA